MVHPQVTTLQSPPPVANRDTLPWGMSRALAAKNWSMPSYKKCFSSIIIYAAHKHPNEPKLRRPLFLTYSLCLYRTVSVGGKKLETKTNIFGEETWLISRTFHALRAYNLGQQKLRTQKSKGLLNIQFLQHQKIKRNKSRGLQNYGMLLKY